MLDGGPVEQAERTAPPQAPARQSAQHPARWRLPRLGPDDRAALGIWAAAHLALLVLAWAAAWTFRTQKSHASLTGVFERWDAFLLRNVAQYGYFSPHSIPNNVAFLPGYPIVLAAAHLILRNWVLSELVVPAAAGCFAVVSLARLAHGRRAVVYLITAPAAIFLMVGYAESLYLALAIPAWHAAVRRRWWRAALLAGLAGLVRPDALFLIPALAVMALADGGSGPAGARLANAAKAGCGFAGLAAYLIYLKVHTGSWNAWFHAQQVGWDEHLVWPIRGLKTTWWAAFQHPFAAGTSFAFQVALAAMAVMVLATVAFAVWRRWPEAVYCGLAVIAVGSSTWYVSLSRTLLMQFPIWIAIAAIGARRPWVRYAYLGISAPLAVVFGLLFLTGQWAG
jgi:hypothetical protein